MGWPKMSDVDQYTDSNATDHEIAKQTLATQLAHAEGKENAIPTRELATKVPVSESTVRDLVPEVRAQYRLPIASCSNGYYRIHSKGEFVEVMERIEGRIETAKDRQREIAKAWNGDCRAE